MDDLVVQALRLHRSTLGLEEQDLFRIAARAHLENVSAGQLLHRSGDTLTSLLLVAKGRLALVLRLADGSEQTIRCLGPGAQFGLLGLLHEMTMPVSLVAETDLRIVRISGPDAKLLMQELPLWKRRLIDSVGGWQTAGIGDRRHHPRMVALLHASRNSQQVAKTLVERLEQLQESMVVLTDSPSSFAGFVATVHSVVDEKGRLLPIEKIRQKIVDAQKSDRVLLSFDVARAAPHVVRLCQGCDRVYWFTRPEDSEQTEGHIAQIVADDSSLVSNMRWVWCLNGQHEVAPLRPSVTKLVGRDIKIHISESGNRLTRLEQRGIAQLVHDLRDVRLGIALSGGAARGMAHLGVLRAIEEAGIVVDAISGTSVGAMVGVVHAAGMPPKEAAECFERDLTPGPLEQKLPGGKLLYLIQKYRRRHWDAMLRVYLHDWQLQQLLTPMSSVSVDLVSGRQYVHLGQQYFSG